MMTIRELIMELRKLGNHEALVELEVRGRLGMVESIESTDIGSSNTVVLLTDKKQMKGVLSASRRCVWP